jgi:hypothetical protein
MSFSPDRRWWWDGRAWIAAVSPDGRWRWNGTAWVPADDKDRPQSPWRAIFGFGPIFGGLVSAGVFWLSTQDAGITIQRAALTWAGLVALRLIDPLLAPVWRLIGKVPGVLRFTAAVAVAAYYSINQLGPGAANYEIEHFQAALFVSIGVAYVLMRPSRGGYGARS